jgi:hypothetical protein
MPKVKLGLDKLSVAQLLELAKQVTKAMTGNASFPTPNPPLAQITTAANDLETARQDALAARNEAKNKTIIQNQREDELKASLRQLVSYVENVSAGNPALITSAGMDVKAIVTSGGDVGAVESFTATTGDSDGEIDLAWNSVPGAQSYIIEQSMQAPPSAGWTQIKTTTKSNATITGLTSGTRYWFRVAAIGASGQGPWSDISTRIAP